jgi:nicotinate-nucleotide pyrophosphorylase (carboxylating)
MSSQRTLPALSPLLVEGPVRAALLEDLGSAGDITSQAVVPENTVARVSLTARDKGVVAGLDLARTAFRLVDASLKISVVREDGASVGPGDDIAMIEGPARSILTGERVALNFMGHLSGVATATRQLVDAIEGTSARICCTRKTTPGLRAFEKHAVLAGGGANHRFGLGDAFLIKDNHIAAAGGISNALKSAQLAAGHMTTIEIEVDTLDQLDEALSAGARVILLDNMTPDQLKSAVKAASGLAVLEASGKINIETVRCVAETGVDFISSGYITHSAPTLDIGLDFDSLIQI